MTQDQELFELCKQVYEATGWDSDDLLHYLGGEVHYKPLFESDMHHLNTTKDTYSPLYTSDYLLEKLPIHTSLRKPLNGIGGGYEAEWYKVTTQEKFYEFEYTPLKALLKLVLKLHEEKLL